MRFSISILLGLLFIQHRSFAQTAANTAVQLSVNVLPQQAFVLSWVPTPSVTSYQIYRKIPPSTAWGPPIATISGALNTYSDPFVSTTPVEYMVKRNTSSYAGYGYVLAGDNTAPIEFRGRLLLIVDSSVMAPLAAELTRLIDDMEGDGWEVSRHDVSRTASVRHVKQVIYNSTMQDSARTKAVFLFGHIPVPYSGNINPDGHPDHVGAWPADMYYGDLGNGWTDTQGPTTTASPLRTQNKPGDGKFDQSVAPSDIELQVGRVDMSRMPAFASTEIALLKNYLDKDHEYRKGIYVPVKRAVIDDNFGYFNGEAFAASAYRNFAPLVGSSNVTANDYFISMSGNSYQWSYGCGGGYYFSASGVGNTNGFANASLDGTFTMLFGSYFGDWDTTNSFLRAPLAQGRMLTSIWSGRPHFQLHHMALGYNIGYSVLESQNNPGNQYYTPPTGISGKWVHTALLGDPTLRNDVVAPVSSVVATRVNNDCIITWNASPQPGVTGYNIYMKNDSARSYIRINNSPLTALSYTDNCLLNKGIYKYMVRAIKPENTAAGTYYNMSEGISDTAWNPHDFRNIAAFTYTLNGDRVHFTNTSTLTSTFEWDYGDGVVENISSPSHTYISNGSYNVMLIATHNCYSDTMIIQLNITDVGIEKTEARPACAFPNPAHSNIRIDGVQPPFSVTIINTSGQVVRDHAGYESGLLDVSGLAPGLYIVRINAKENFRLIIE